MSTRSTAGMVVQLRDAIGDVPPPLVGASTTIFGSKIVLFGGCVPSSSTVMSDLYVLDVELCKWEKLLPPAQTPALRGRCFHTADIWNNHLVVFGGLSVINSNASERLQDLNQVNLLDLSTYRWLPTKAGKSTSTIPPPPARHNHISCISANHLVVLGGVDGWGERLEDICVYDLERQEWVRTQRYSCPLDVDRAFCATSRWRVCTPPLSPPYASSPEESFALAPEPLPYSEAASLESPSELYLFNSSQPTIDVLTPLPNGEIRIPPPRSVVGSRQPTATHRPNGAILGTTLVLSGNSPPVVGASPSFTVWTLDLTNHLWTRIDTGDLVKTGVWSSGHLWNPHNKFLVLGTKRPCSPSTVTELPNHYDTVAFVDLEALGIYQAPARSLDPAHQRRALSILGEGRRADFAFVCSDGREIPCARVLVAGRWPWLHDQLDLLHASTLILELKGGKHTPITVNATKCTIGASYPVVQALLQYFYALALGTALQRAPAVLSHLLLIATEFRISYLQALVKHALHLALSEETAAGVYEVAASCGCRSLQIRAFSIHSRRWLKTGRARSHSEGTQTRPRKHIVGSLSESSTNDLAQKLAPNEDQKPAPPKPNTSLPKARLSSSPRTAAVAPPPLPTPLSPLLLHSRPPIITRKMTNNNTAPSPPLHDPYAVAAPTPVRPGRPTLARQSTAPVNGSRSRSQSAGPGSRIPRPPSRQEQQQQARGSPPRSRSTTPRPIAKPKPPTPVPVVPPSVIPVQVPAASNIPSSASGIPRSRSAHNLGKLNEVAGPRLPTYRRRNTVSREMT